MAEEEKEPDVKMAISFGLLAVSLGVVMGVVYMISFPLNAYSSLGQREKALDAKEDGSMSPGDAYYFEGGVARGDSWKTARSQLLEGGVSELEVSTGEINAWLSTYFQTASPKPGEKSSGIAITPKVPNLAVIEAGEMYVSLPATIDCFGMKGAFVVSAKGEFRSGNPAKFKTRNLQINGARFPGLVGQQLLKSLAGAYAKTDEYASIQEAWQSVESVELVEGALRLKMR